MHELTLKQQELLRDLQSFKLTHHLKKAAPDAKKTFENNFSVLVDSIMDEHFPRLKKYDLGFQLIEKSADNTKAFGVRALRLRSLAFIPFFYNNGTISGYEVIYVPKLNLFFPATEAWCVYLTSRSKEPLGLPDESLKDHYQKLFPNLLSLRRPLIYKTAASNSKLLPEYLRKYATVGKRLYAFIDKAPWLIEKLAHFYGIEILELVKESARREVPAPRHIRDIPSIEKSAKLRIYHEFQDPVVYSDLTIEEREQLFKRGYFIKDARDDSSVSKAFRVFRRDAFFAIDSPGVYEVVDSDFNIHKATAYFVDGTLTVTIHDSNNTEITLSKDKALYDYVPIQSTVYAIRKVSDFPDSEILEEIDSNKLGRGDKVVFDYTGRGVNIRRDSDEVLVSPNAKKITVTVFPINTRKHRHDRSLHRIIVLPKTCYRMKENIYVETPNNKPSYTFLSPFLLDHPNPALTTIKVSFDRHNNRYFIGNRAFSKFDALCCLIKDYNLREKTASEIIRDAELKETTKYWVKAADSSYIRNEDKPSPYFVEAPRGEWAPGYPHETNLEVETWVPGLRRPQPILNILEPPPLKVIQKIKQLADANDGEAFDLGLINSLLYTTNIDDYIPQIIRGLDSMCRILFVSYKHRDQIEERYGKEDYKKIIESLKSCIETVGDLIVDLSQQKIDPYINSLEVETDTINT